MVLGVVFSLMNNESYLPLGLRTFVFLETISAPQPVVVQLPTPWPLGPSGVRQLMPVF